MHLSPLFALLVAAAPSTPTQAPQRITPGQPLAFQLSAFGPGELDFSVTVPSSAAAMHVWTTDASDDIALSVEGFSDDWGDVQVHGPDVWLDESVHFGISDIDPLFAGEWTIHVSFANGSLVGDLPTSTNGVLHVEFLEPLRATLRPGDLLETELHLDQGYRAVLSLPPDFAPERKSEWLVEAYSPTRDIDLVVGPSKLPGTLDYPYAQSTRVINYERCIFEGRQAKNLAIHVFSFLDSEETQPIPIRVRLSKVRADSPPSSILPPLELPAPGPTASPSLQSALAATVAVFGPLGSGSGTLLSASGLVLTNAHVAVAPAASLTPAARKHSRLMGSGPTYYAGFQHDPRTPVAPEVCLELIASREDLDLALLRITTTLDGRPLRDLHLPRMSWGDPMQLSLGDPLFALGFPMTGGLGELVTPTVTRGICSGFDPQEGNWAIKTDAGVHSGISGGALLTDNWQLVGIPSSSIVDSNFAGGIGYAIPVTSVPGAWTELAQREDLDLVMDALNAELSGNIEVFPASTPLEWALLRADAAALASGDATSESRLIEAGVQAFGPLLAELSSKDLQELEQRKQAGRLTAALDRLMLGHGPTWQTIEGASRDTGGREENGDQDTAGGLSESQLKSAVGADMETISDLAQKWKAVCKHPDSWSELMGMRDGAHPTESASFEQLLKAQQ